MEFSLVFPQDDKMYINFFKHYHFDPYTFQSNVFKQLLQLPL